MEPLKISYNDHTLFHMLRHFESINDAALACLLDRGYSKKRINEQLNMPGSKFYSFFANDLKSFEQVLQLGVIKDCFSRNGYTHHSLEFEASDFAKGIGSIGVASISVLKEKGITEFEWKQNRGLELCHAKLKTLPHTHHLTMVLKPQKNYQLLITAFPGMMSLPIPKKGMNELFFTQCQQFWSEHAFLELE